MLRTRNFPLLSWIWRQISHFGDHFSFSPQLFHYTNLSQPNTSSGDLVEVAEQESRTRYRTAFMCSLIHWLGLRLYETGWIEFQNHFTVLNVVKLRTRNFLTTLLNLTTNTTFTTATALLQANRRFVSEGRFTFCDWLNKMTCESRGVENLRFDDKRSGQCLPS